MFTSFHDRVVLAAPHHPRYEWILDKTSDLSHIASYGTAQRYLCMYSSLARLSAQQQDATFVPLCTAERLWKTRALEQGLLLNRTFGYFAMLRNASTFRLPANTGYSKRRAELLRRIFAVVDGSVVPCPDPSEVMFTMPPPPAKRPASHAKKKT